MLVEFHYRRQVFPLQGKTYKTMYSNLQKNSSDNFPSKMFFLRRNLGLTLSKDTTKFNCKLCSSYTKKITSWYVEVDAYLKGSDLDSNSSTRPIENF
ncbi:hypothetical protein PR048_012894 [Dryococelus australis]|uniref:Uncharacterized protein n=1 Tax=Dryococelus australis TaxID=614101 RepID=A0ABQ9HQL4_9NEOP|nr:hypothetical protein PR048_012894 [Dryococelus australis]